MAKEVFHEIREKNAIKCGKPEILELHISHLQTASRCSKTYFTPLIVCGNIAFGVTYFTGSYTGGIKEPDFAFVPLGAGGMRRDFPSVVLEAGWASTGAGIKRLVPVA
ncbi:hypothetical protein HOY80DRAFT_1138024 [Tuber brumale]|nr:hypothetical protein HOY80DRAFT_1138024 [Tuber brumale]